MWSHSIARWQCTMRTGSPDWKPLKRKRLPLGTMAKATKLEAGTWAL